METTAAQTADTAAGTPPKQQIRAVHTADTVTVYQAFGPEIAEPAAAEGRFPEAFDRDRMTWIKPSFLWMMHRSDWGRSPGQERVLALEISREGFDWALERAVLSAYTGRVHESRAAWKRELRQSPVRVQWDPERGLNLEPLAWRTIQIGLRGEAVRRYADEWIRRITDVTALAERVRAGRDAGVVPVEGPYPVRGSAAARVGAAAGV
ncbi:DUF4291 domain-containing protein [Streptomyces rubellomurinus]|uniref:DUF4291 domain-containing protein n=1 Tax=Streptomyces rubellomurinus (strain ATCC 31215) TaxID=359131 RepID=A0A0F2TD57_STRR3|nr:DUF4291 domain-containing protein [Streptomyces rubellomurinus]KJS60436.1 hypothetical protein VM95_21030 [Streptomyces rubellomurinus]